MVGREFTDSLFHGLGDTGQSSGQQEARMKDAFLFLGVILTFVIGVWNIVNNYRLSRRTTFVNTVTAERVKWIEKLRDNISTLCGLTYTWQASKLEGQAGEQDVLKQIDKLRHLIRLQLNPEGEQDKKIEALIGKIPNLTHESNSPELKIALDELVIVSQRLLKDEWEKVKEESKRGDLKETKHCLAPILRRLNACCLKATSRFSKP